MPQLTARSSFPARVGARATLAGAAFAAFVIAAVALTRLDPHVLAVLPALLLPALLVLRRYPGERIVHALARVPRRSLPRPRVSTAPRMRFERAMPRGGRLLGSCLAVRPPPAPALAAS